MECVEAMALKSSFRREVVLQPFAEELCSGVVGVAPCEEFLVDELFDFSNEEDLAGGIEGEEEEEEDEEKAREQKKDGLEGEGAVVPCGSGSADSDTKDHLAAVQTGELSVPADDLADLEWLSHFVEDSFCGFSSPFPASVFPGKVNSAAEGKEGVKAGVAGAENRGFKTPVHARARRSQRPRTGGKVWMLRSPSLSETSSSSSSSSSSNCITSDSLTLASFELAEPLPKKQRKWGNYGSGPGQAAARKCSHCGVQKTPQWRAGPLGSKTLCNACGVRFKSGRLFPEYRPACSPTFSSELHSNHHRKVLEMRRRKESPPSVQTEPGLAVPSF